MNKQDQSIYTSMKVCNLLVSAVSLVIGVLIIFFSTQLGIGSSKSTGRKAGTWPWIMVKIGLIDVCMLVAVYIIFEVGLKVKLPEPIWM